MAKRFLPVPNLDSRVRAPYFAPFSFAMLTIDAYHDNNDNSTHSSHRSNQHNGYEFVLTFGPQALFSIFVRGDILHFWITKYYCIIYIFIIIKEWNGCQTEKTLRRMAMVLKMMLYKIWLGKLWFYYQHMWKLFAVVSRGSLSLLFICSSFYIWIKIY